MNFYNTVSDRGPNEPKFVQNSVAILQQKKAAFLVKALFVPSIILPKKSSKLGGELKPWNFCQLDLGKLLEASTVITILYVSIYCVVGL